MCFSYFLKKRKEIYFRSLVKAPEVEASTSSFAIYDAIPDSEESEDGADPEMKKFGSLLSDYLHSKLTPQ